MSFENTSNIRLTSLFRNQVDHKDLIELFCELDLSAYHQDISECFESAAFEAIDHLLKVSHYTLDTLHWMICASYFSGDCYLVVLNLVILDE